MDSKIFPIDSEFESEEQAASHDRWLQAKVQASRDDSRPSIAHDEVMAEMHALIESMRKKADAD